MADFFVSEPSYDENGATWPDRFNAQLRRSEGVLTTKLFNDNGTLKLKEGKIGIDDGTRHGVIAIDERTVLAAGLGLDPGWYKTEAFVDVDDYNILITLTPVADSITANVLPVSFKTAYKGAKGGFYLTTSKRTIGLAWLNTAGVLEGIVNALPFIDGWVGYSQSNDANDDPYVFDKNIDDTILTEGSNYATSEAGVSVVSVEASRSYPDGSATATKDFILKKPISFYMKLQNGFNSGMSISSTGNLTIYQNGGYRPLNISISASELVTGYSYGTTYINTLNPGRYRLTTSVTISGNIYEYAAGWSTLSLMCTGVYGSKVIDSKNIIIAL